MREKTNIELRRCQRCGVADINHVCSYVEKDSERADIARQNAAALTGLMGQYNFLIPARTFHLWRPTKRVKGDIDGVHEALELIATDGILGWFVTHDELAWLGHIQCFSGKVEPLFSFDGQMSSKAKIKKPRKKSKRQAFLETI